MKLVQENIAHFRTEIKCNVIQHFGTLTIYTALILLVTQNKQGYMRVVVNIGLKTMNPFHRFSLISAQ